MENLMRKILMLLIVLVSISMLNVQAKAQLLSPGFVIGLSTPNDKVGDIYNHDNLDLGNSKEGNLISKGMDAGYNLGVKLRLPLNDNIHFVGSIGWNRFPEQTLEVRDPKADTVLLTLESSTNIIPITAGVNAYLFKSFIGLYATGDLSYNYISSSVDYKRGDVSIPIKTSPSDNRLGFGLGLGVDFNVGLVILNIEGKYNHTNLIGKDDKEKDKSYVTLGVGIFF